MQQCNNNGVPSMQKTARSGFDHPSNKNERIATRYSHFAFPCNDCVNFEKRGAKKKYTEEKRKRTKRNEKKREEKNKTRRKKKKQLHRAVTCLSLSLSLPLPLHLCSSGVILGRSERKEYRVGASDKSGVRVE